MLGENPDIKPKYHIWYLSNLNPNFTNLKSKQDISFLSRSGYQVMAIRFEKTKFKVWCNCYLKPYSLCSQPLSKSIRSSNLSLGPHLFFLSSHYIFLLFFCLHFVVFVLFFFILVCQEYEGYFEPNELVNI